MRPYENTHLWGVPSWTRHRADEDIGPYGWWGPRGARPPGRAGPSPWGEAMMGSPPKPSGDSRGFGGERRSSEMSEFSPLGGSERYGTCDDEGAACGRPRAHAVRPYGNTHHRRARPLGVPRPAGSSGPTEYAPRRAGACPCRHVGAHLCVRPGRVGGPMWPPGLSLRRGFRRATSLVRGRLFVEAFLWPPLMRGLSAVRLTGGEKTVGDRRRGGLWPPAGARRAPLRMMTHPMWRGILDAPYLPPGGKVARRAG